MYKKNFLKHYKIGIHEYVACAVCGGQAIELHHIIKRSSLGSDEVENLLPVCRSCHMDCEARKYSEEEQQECRKAWTKKRVC
jgi:hypothetical protein